MEDQSHPSPVLHLRPQPATAATVRPQKPRHGVGHPVPDDTRQQILSCLREGVGILTIARSLKVSTHTILQIREEHSDQLPDWRLATRNKLRAFITLSGERLVNEVGEIPIAVLPVAHAIAIDKMLLLEGEATIRVEHVARQSPAQFTEWLSRMVAGPVVDVETHPAAVKDRPRDS